MRGCDRRTDASPRRRAAGRRPSPAMSSPFSETDRAALHAEIRAYLLEHPEILMEMIQLLEEKQRVATEEGDRALVASNAAADLRRRLLLGRRQPRGQLHRRRVPRLPVRLLPQGAARAHRADRERRRHPADRQGDADPRAGLRARGPRRGRHADHRGPEAYATLHDRLMELKGEITDASLDQALAEVGLDPAAIRAGDGRPGGRPPARRHPRACGDAGDLRHADLRLRRPDGARLPAAGADARPGGRGTRATN